jgi:hypothetical protein
LRTNKFWNCDQSTAFCSAAQRKHFGIVNKSSVFCSAAQRKFWNLPTNTTQTCRAAKNLGIYRQIQLKLAARPKI